MTTQLDALRDRLTLVLYEAGLREQMSMAQLTLLLDEWCAIAEVYCPELDTTPAGRGR